MAQGVVDLLEAVEVDQADVEGAGVGLRALFLVRHALPDVAAVEDAGQRIADGELVDDAVGVLQAPEGLLARRVHHQHEADDADAKEDETEGVQEVHVFLHVHGRAHAVAVQPVQGEQAGGRDAQPA